jgi:hypothetical protein
VRTPVFQDLENSLGFLTRRDAAQAKIETKWIQSIHHLIKL